MKIAFGYKARSGKDTSVDYLCKTYGGTALSFAEPLYTIQSFAQSVCGFEAKKDRKFLQYIGTEWARSNNKDVWINILASKVQNGNNYISDLRFKNELDYLKSNEWICIKIVRYNLNVSEDAVNTIDSSHQSEMELDSVDNSMWDYIIINDGSIDDLYRQLDLIIYSISDSL